MNDRNAQYDLETGKPLDQSYLECGLPEDLHESILRMEESWNIIDSGRQDNHLNDPTQFEQADET